MLVIFINFLNGKPDLIHPHPIVVQYHLISPTLCVSQEYCNQMVGRYFGSFLSYMDKPLALNNRINNYNILGDYRENASLNETLDDVCEEKNQNNESFTKGLFNTIFSYMNQSFQESKFQTYTIIPENKLIQGSKVDFLIKGKNILTSSTNKDICFVEVKPLRGSIWSAMYQVLDYVREDQPNENRYLIAMAGPHICYFLYEKGWHMSHGFKYKAPAGQDLLGLAYDFKGNKVRIINQHDTLEPQVKIYDLRMPQENLACLFLNKWLAYHIDVPKVRAEFVAPSFENRDLVFKHPDVATEKTIGFIKLKDVTREYPVGSRIVMTGRGEILKRPPFT